MVYAVRGFISMVHDWDWNAAAVDLRQSPAIALTYRSRSFTGKEPSR
jgi:hypothetical protein